MLPCPFKYAGTVPRAMPAHYMWALPFINSTLLQLEPLVNGPFTPDLSNPISKLGEAAQKNDWPLDIRVCEWPVLYIHIIV